MCLQPVLIAYPTNIPQSAVGRACSESAALPNNAHAKPDNPPENAEPNCSLCALAMLSWNTTQDTQNRSQRSRCGCISNYSAKERSEGVSMEERFLTGTCSRQPRIQNLATVLNLGL